MTNASKFRNENAWWCVKISVVFFPDLSVSLSSCCCRCCFWPRRQGGAKGSKKKPRKNPRDKRRQGWNGCLLSVAKPKLICFFFSMFFFLANSRFWWKRRWRGMDVGGWVDPSCRFIMKLLLFGWSCGEAAVHAAWLIAIDFYDFV